MFFDPNTDVHVVAGIVKSFLRSMKEPLLTYELYTAFLNAASMNPQLALLISSDPRDMRAALAALPKAHFETAKYLFKFLYNFSQYKAVTSMDTVNIAIVIGPNILRPSDDGNLSLNDTPLVLKTTQRLIDKYYGVFEHRSDLAGPAKNESPAQEDVSPSIPRGLPLLPPSFLPNSLPTLPPGSLPLSYPCPSFPLDSSPSHYLSLPHDSLPPSYPPASFSPSFSHSMPPSSFPPSLPPDSLPPPLPLFLSMPPHSPLPSPSDFYHPESYLPAYPPPSMSDYYQPDYTPTDLGSLPPPDSLPPDFAPPLPSSQPAALYPTPPSPTAAPSWSRPLKPVQSLQRPPQRPSSQHSNPISISETTQQPLSPPPKRPLRFGTMPIQPSSSLPSTTPPERPGTLKTANSVGFVAGKKNATLRRPVAPPEDVDDDGKRVSPQDSFEIR